MQDSNGGILVNINSEEDAWDELKLALHSNIEGNYEIVLKDWPILNFTIIGADFNGTIPTRIMPALLDLQNEIFKLYCETKYGNSNPNKLTNEERNALELIVKISNGSSNFFVDLCNALNEAIKNSNMSGKEAVLLFVSIGVIISGTIGWLATISADERKHGIDNYKNIASLAIPLSEQETERFKILSEAIKEVKVLNHHKEAIVDFQREILRRLKPTDQLEVDGQFIIDGEHAAEILPSPKEITKDIRLDGNYVINYVKLPKEFGGPYRISITAISDEKTYRVDVAPDLLTDEQFGILKDSAFDIKPVFMQINAKKNRDNIFDARLFSIDWAEKNDELIN